jgi:mannose-6-phosphate isomerase-like protein (cupin superfamily)
MGAYTDMGSYQGTELKTRMTATQKTKTQKTKAKKVVNTGRMAPPAAPAGATKKVQMKKKTTKATISAMDGTIATSFYHVKHAGGTSHAGADGEKAVSIKAGSDAEMTKTHSLYTSAKKNAQVKKNRTKLASYYLHTHAGTGSRTVSDEEKANAHSIHTSAKKSAQVKKNVAKVASHDLHNRAGMKSHTVSDEEKAVAIQAGSHDAKLDAHNPHKHPGAGALKGAGHEKTGVHKSGKKGYVANIEEETRKNRDFRRVLYTGTNCQLVLMSLKPGEDIGLETHGDVDQFFRFEAGQGIVEIDGMNHAVKDGSGVIVPCGAMHNVTNTSETELLKLYTIYAPPEHQDKVVRKTKREALSAEEHFDGKTTEKYH